MTHPSPTNALPIQTQYHHEASYLSPWHTWIWRHNDVILGHDEFCESKPYSPCQPIYFCLKLFKLPLKLSPDDSPFMTSHIMTHCMFFRFWKVKVDISEVDWRSFRMMTNGVMSNKRAWVESKREIPVLEKFWRWIVPRVCFEEIISNRH